MNIARYIYNILSVILILTPIEAQIISDPVADFMAHMHKNQNDELYKIIAPVNRSGGNEVFLTFSHSSNGEAGYIWSVYAPIAGGYQLLDTPITFQLYPLSIGNFKELGGVGMLTYFPDASGTGRLIGYVFEGTKIYNRDLGSIEFSGKDKPLTDKYFTEANHPDIETTPADKLPKATYYSESTSSTPAPNITHAGSTPPLFAPQSSPTAPSPIPIAKVETSHSFPWSWTIGVSFLLLGGVILFLLRKFDGR